MAIDRISNEQMNVTTFETESSFIAFRTYYDGSELVIDWNHPVEDSKRPLGRDKYERALLNERIVDDVLLGGIATAIAFITAGPEVGLPAAAVSALASVKDVKKERNSLQRERLAFRSKKTTAALRPFKDAFAGGSSVDPEATTQIIEFERQLRAGEVYETESQRVLRISEGATLFAGEVGCDVVENLSMRLYQLGLVSGIDVTDRGSLIERRNAIMDAIKSYDSNGPDSLNWVYGETPRYGKSPRQAQSSKVLGKNLINEWTRNAGDNNATRAIEMEKRLRDINEHLLQLGSSDTLVSFNLKRLVQSIVNHPHGDDLLESTIGQLYLLNKFATEQRVGGRLWAHTGDATTTLTGELAELVDILQNSAFTISSVTK